MSCRQEGGNIVRTNIKIGVLALQGAFREHIRSIERCGVAAKEIRHPQQLKDIDGLILPGGESTTIFKLVHKYGFQSFLDVFHKEEKPIFGTCAGMILLSKKVEGYDFGLGYIDIEVQRNFYGRQIDSFEEYIEINFPGSLKTEKFKAVFIRAPKIIKASKHVDVLSKIDEDIVFARQKNILVSSFHPELEDDLRIHEYFINMIINHF
jgi:pyridoxal 5'-phosphate synthase pdxT subunit